MLRITMSKSAEGAKKYYCESYYKEGQSTQLDYYTEKNEAIGRWGGKAAAKLGLEGRIAPADFAALCDNIDPNTGETLTARQVEGRTVGYDFTFNASKSVSLAYAFGSEEEKRELLRAFQVSVRETMEEVESGMQARVRADGKDENRFTGNLAYGEFTHFTTRPIEGIGDPALHSHCFVLNASWDEQDSKWKAGQFMPLKQDAPYYEALFHSKLATKLQQLGYRTRRTEHNFEIEGIDAALIEKFSRRTEEIEAYARKHGITDAEQKAQIGARTREAKRGNTSPAAQEADWQARLTNAERAALENLKQQGSQVSNEETTVKHAQAALQFSLAHHLERKSVTSDKEILATAIKSSIGDTSPDAVKQAFHEDSNLLHAENKLRRFVTTKEALREEKQLIAAAIRSKNRFRPIHETYEVQNELLNDQQQRAVKHALSTTDGVILITGKAGTGKTTLMTEVKLGIEASGKHIFAFAPSSEASRGVQRSEGFEDAETVAKLIQDTKRHEEFRHQVLWIDEAGMLSNRDMNHILAIAEAQSARVILSGDTKQHTSVERGDAMRILQKEAGMKPITVDKIQRQKHTQYREAMEALSAGQLEKGFQKLDKMGAIHEISDSDARIQAIAEDYHRSAYGNAKAPIRDVLIVSPTHAEGDAVSQRIRSRLKEAQVIGQAERSYTTLKNLQFTEAEKQRAESYQPGHILSFHQNAKGIKAGKRLTVTTAESDRLYATDAEGTAFTVPLAESRKFSVFTPKQTELAEGDKIRITSNGQSMEGTHLFNGNRYYVRGFDDKCNIRLSNGATLPREFGHFQHGYVGTSHSSQGKTADKVIISQSSASFRASSEEQFYVSVSRARHSIAIYTDNKEHLQQAVTHSSERTSASELMAMRQKQTEQMRQAAMRETQQRKAAQLQETYQFNARQHELQKNIREQREAR